MSPQVSRREQLLRLGTPKYVQFLLSIGLKASNPFIVITAANPRGIHIQRGIQRGISRLVMAGLRRVGHLAPGRFRNSQMCSSNTSPSRRNETTQANAEREAEERGGPWLC
jgi:hypothetical protein